MNVSLLLPSRQVLDAPELELQMAMRYQVGAGNRTRVLFKSNKRH